ncbi:MAG: SEC-C metal-binding domain-containing protein, partial [Gammaproteobacteria bacterium]|nr:SEC-C metal-binding domain-containing protein [Gammaproteobacteria bacterium]
SRVQIEAPDEVAEAERRRREEAEQRMRFTHAETSALDNGAPAPGAGPGPADDEPAARPETFVRGERKVGRNEPCPCGSGKKFKQCHGKAA